ncbi:MAG: MBL fold metallo-hydrolase, partial [Muribaculaceae bacterium]|nr:MBL fold metallo-hydrolase [Muribaculaceae bacterium]
YPGVPAFNINEVSTKPFEVADLEVVPLPVMHHRLPILGFKMGNLAYITDAKTIPDSTIELIRGIDTLVINALRIKDHISHMNLQQALAVIREVKPRVAYITHMSHDMGLHNEASMRLPEGVKLAYDGLIIHIPDNDDGREPKAD